MENKLRKATAGPKWEYLTPEESRSMEVAVKAYEKLLKMRKIVLDNADDPELKKSSVWKSLVKAANKI